MCGINFDETTIGVNIFSAIKKSTGQYNTVLLNLKMPKCI